MGEMKQQVEPVSAQIAASASELLTGCSFQSVWNPRLEFNFVVQMAWKYCMAQFGQEGEQIMLDICAGYCTYENWGIQALLADETKAVFHPMSYHRQQL